jgi:hypothetical protein
MFVKLLCSTHEPCTLVRCRLCEPWAHMCSDCVCVHNSLAIHEVDKWSTEEGMYRPYTFSGDECVFFAPAQDTAASFQTTSGRWKDVNLGVGHSLAKLFARGIFVANPARLLQGRTITRSFSFTFLDVCVQLTQEAHVSQTNLQRVFADASIPDSHLFNEAYLFYRVIKRQLVDRSFLRFHLDKPPSGTPWFSRCLVCLCCTYTDSRHPYFVSRLSSMLHQFL